MPEAGGTDGPEERIGIRWVGLALWLLLLIGIDMVARTVGIPQRQGIYLIAVALASVGVVAIVGFARLANAPPELRTLRVLAVLLPTVFIFCTQIVLYFLEVDEAVTEAGEHIFATAIISSAAVPFSVYVFRSFTRLRDELARRAHHLQSLHETSMSVTSDPSLPHLYGRIAEGIRDVVTADGGVLLLAANGGRPEPVASSPPAQPLGSWDRELAASVVSSRKTVRAFDDARAFLGVPLSSGGKVIGVIGALRTGGQSFGVEEELLLGMFAVAASAGVENAQRLAEAQLVATVEERERIARDLHDDLGQLLGFLTAKTQAAQELVVAGRGEQARDELASLERASRALGAQVREAILGLRARVGPDRPLASALDDYVAEFGIQAGLSTDYAATPEAGGGLPGAAQYQLLRIAQEALSNARRHAQARRVTVRLIESDGRLELTVADDGDGFDPREARSGFGLKTMTERVQALNGTFEVLSAPGSGTTVKVLAPLSTE